MGYTLLKHNKQLTIQAGEFILHEIAFPVKEVVFKYVLHLVDIDGTQLMLGD